MKRKWQFAHNRAGCPAYGIGHGGPNGRCARLADAGRGLGRLNDMDIHLRHVADPQLRQESVDEGLFGRLRNVWTLTTVVRAVRLPLAAGYLVPVDLVRTFRFRLGPFLLLRIPVKRLLGTERFFEEGIEFELLLDALFEGNTRELQQLQVLKLLRLPLL